MQIKILCALLCIVLFACSANAAIIYVDKDNGCNGAGTTGDPYCTIALAMSAAQPGDTIRIRDAASAYNEQVFSARSGSSGLPIIIEPDIGHNPNLVSSNANSTNGVINIANHSFWTIRNLRFDASAITATARYAIKVSTSSGNITDNHVTGNTVIGWGGSDQGGPSNNGENVINSASIIMTGLASSGLRASGTITGNTVTGSKLQGITLGYTSNALVEGNIVTGMRCGVGAIGSYPYLAAINNGGTNGGDIDGIIRGNTVSGFQSSADCRAELINAPGTPVLTGIYCDVGSLRFTIEKNDISGLDNNGGNPNMAGIYWEYDCNDTVIKNNKIHNVDTRGMRISSFNACSHNSGNEVYNNTVQVNGSGWGIGVEGHVENITVRNNIFFMSNTSAVPISVEAPAAACGGHTINNNLYYTNGGTIVGNWGGAGNVNFASWKSACGCDADSINSDPLFTNLAGSDFTLQTTSPAKESGFTIASVTDDYSGSSRTVPYSMGAFEFGGAPAPSGSGQLELRVIRKLQ